MTPKQQKLREKYTSALGNENVRQLLNGIGHTESGNRYNIRYSGERNGAKIDMSQPGDHPNILATRKDGRKSSAAGRYMFTQPTWKDAQKALGLTNFNDPAEQDLAAAWLLDQTKSGQKTGLQHALDGNMQQAADAGSQRWEAISKIGAQKFAQTLPQYRAVEFGKLPQQTIQTPSTVAKSTPAVSKSLVDTSRLGRVGTAQGDGQQYGPVASGEFRYVTQQQPLSDALSFRQGIDAAHNMIDQRMVPGTPESFTVNPLRRMAADFGWALPEQADKNILNVNNALNQGKTFAEWENNAAKFFGVKPTATEENNGLTRWMAQPRQEAPAPVEDKSFSWSQALNPMSEARNEANQLMFGESATTGQPAWPTGLNDAIGAATEEAWNRG